MSLEIGGQVEVDVSNPGNLRNGVAQNVYGVGSFQDRRRRILLSVDGLCDRYASDEQCSCTQELTHRELSIVGHRVVTKCCRLSSWMAGRAAASCPPAGLLTLEANEHDGFIDSFSL